MLVGEAVIYGFGLVWLSLYIPSAQLLAAGLYPFLPGAAVKVAVAALLLPTVLANGRAFSSLSRTADFDPEPGPKRCPARLSYFKSHNEIMISGHHVRPEPSDRSDFR